MGGQWGEVGVEEFGSGGQVVGVGLDPSGVREEARAAASTLYRQG